MLLMLVWKLASFDKTKTKERISFHERRDVAPPLAPTIAQAHLGSARANLVAGITWAGGGGGGRGDKQKGNKMQEA